MSAEEDSRLGNKAEASGAAWLHFWLASSDWTPEEAAQVLIGIVPGMGGSVFFPGLEPRGTVYGEGGEPPAVTAAEKLLRPEAYRQTEAGPCARRELWLKQQSDRVSRIVLRIDPTKLERPTDLIAWALERDIVPPWLDHARADPSLARVLPTAPGAPANPPLVTAKTGSSRKRQERRLWPTPDPALIARWPKLYASMGDGWEAGAWTSLQQARDRYPCWAHTLVSTFYHRDKTNSQIAADLMEEPGLLLEENYSFSPARVAQWRTQYLTEDKLANRLLAVRVLQWRLLRLQKQPAPLSPDLDAFLLDAENSA